MSFIGGQSVPFIYINSHDNRIYLRHYYYSENILSKSERIAYLHFARMLFTLSIIFMKGMLASLGIKQIYRYGLQVLLGLCQFNGLGRNMLPTGT